MSENAGKPFDWAAPCDVCGSDATWRAYPTLQPGDGDNAPPFHSRVVRCVPCRLVVADPRTHAQPADTGSNPPSLIVSALAAAAARAARWTGAA